MANNNFVVQNGLTVGNTTIFAGNGDVITTGNISVSGGGSFGGLSSSQIFQGTNSNVTVSVNQVTIGVAGANVAVFTATGETFVPNMTITGNLTVNGTTTTVNAENVIGSLTPSANLTYTLGNTTNWWSTVYGNSFVGTSTSARYADLAENYQADKFYNPGTVLMFGGDAEVTLAEADTTRVAGVISTNPAHLMNGGLTGSSVAAVALMGRVPCMVIGPVAKGDLMVSAGFGYAKVNNSAQPGQVIGKALADFPIAAKGVIEVVVGRV
jgi:hypothetical protein